MFVGFADRLTDVAAGSPIVTFTEVSMLPLSPVHERLKVLSFVIELRVSVPEVSLLPDQSPEAVQLVTLVLLQPRVVDPPSLINSGVAVNEIVGASSHPVRKKRMPRMPKIIGMVDFTMFFPLMRERLLLQWKW
jgi:hypothetical protein